MKSGNALMYLNFLGNLDDFMGLVTETSFQFYQRVKLFDDLF